MDISLSESPALARLLRRPTQAVRAAGVLAAKRMAEQYVEDVLDYIDSERPYDPVTGSIEGSVGWRAEGDGARVFAGGAAAPHAQYVEFETAAHVILPGPREPRTIAVQAHSYIRNGTLVEVGAYSYLSDRGALRWYPAGGGIVFAGGVQHPGTDAMPFFFADIEARRERMRGVARVAFGEVLLGDANV